MNGDDYTPERPSLADRLRDLTSSAAARPEHAGEPAGEPVDVTDALGRIESTLDALSGAVQQLARREDLDGVARADHLQGLARRDDAPAPLDLSGLATRHDLDLVADAVAGLAARSTGSEPVDVSHLATRDDLDLVAGAIAELPRRDDVVQAPVDLSGLATRDDIDLIAGVVADLPRRDELTHLASAAEPVDISHLATRDDIDLVAGAVVELVRPDHLEPLARTADLDGLATARDLDALADGLLVTARAEAVTALADDVASLRTEIADVRELLTTLTASLGGMADQAAADLAHAVDTLGRRTDDAAFTVAETIVGLLSGAAPEPAPETAPQASTTLTKATSAPDDATGGDDLAAVDEVPVDETTPALPLPVQSTGPAAAAEPADAVGAGRRRGWWTGS